MFFVGVGSRKIEIRRIMLTTPLAKAQKLRAKRIPRRTVPFLVPRVGCTQFCHWLKGFLSSWFSQKKKILTTTGRKNDQSLLSCQIGPLRKGEECKKPLFKMGSKRLFIKWVSEDLYVRPQYQKNTRGSWFPFGCSPIDRNNLWDKPYTSLASVINSG